MSRSTLTIWHPDGTTRDVALDPGVYHAGSDLGCDFYFHPDDAVPRFDIDSTAQDGSVTITPRQNGVSLDGQALPIETPVLWPSDVRLSAGSIEMTLATADTASHMPAASKQASASSRLLFGISTALMIGYFVLGLFETSESAPTTALAASQNVMTIRQASAEIRRLTDGWPTPVKPSVMVGAKQMTVRLQPQAEGNTTLLAQIESFRIQPDESISVLDVPYSDEQFTALGIDALVLRPRKVVMTRLGTTLGVGEMLGASWRLRDITSADITVSRGNLTKAIRLKAM